MTGLPMLAVGSTTLTAGWKSMFEIFLKLPNRTQGLVDTACTAVLMSCTVFLAGALVVALRRTDTVEPGSDI